MPDTDSSTSSIALIVDSRQRRNRFGRYAGEILRAEGIGDFDELELGATTAADLTRYGVVVLTNCGAMPGLAETLGEYLEGGGRLLLIQPALELAPLLGLQPLFHVGHQTSLLVDSESGAFGGFPYEPVQVIGPVDRYRTGDAATAGLTVLARTVTGYWPVEQHPAIVERAVGRGRVLAFLYDLPHTVARLRQGDPALAECDSDGLVGVRPSDAIQWQIDPRAGHLPQAEVHQALLARAVEWLCPWPLPRLWYLPGEAQSILILTGDLCTNRPDTPQMLQDEAALAARHGGALTFYLNVEAMLERDVVAGLYGGGHTLSIHPFAVPFSAPHMETTLAQHLQKFEERFGPRPRTVRHHRLQWLGWADQAKIEQRHGLAMDLNFTTARPVRNGYLFGAGRPLRFVDEGGAIVETWQQPTQFEDDLILGNHEISLRIGTAEACALYDQLLDEAIARWHSVVAVNLHPGNYARYSRDWGRHLVSSTARKGVPIWNPERWLDFTAQRAGLSVARPTARERGQGEGVSWRIDVPQGTDTGDLVLLLPERFDGHALAQPAVGPTFNLYGWGYLGIALHGAPAAFDAVYGAERAADGGR